MTIPRLPPEILHAVVTSYLSPTSDISTLHALSLTHSLLLRSARAVLFHTIRLTRHHLDDGVRPHLCHAFSALLHRSPHIAEFVQKLVILEGTIRNSWHGNMRFWVNSEGEELPFILRMVAFGRKDHTSTVVDTTCNTPLRSLEILGFGKATMNWETFTPELRRAFQDVFENGELEDLRLVGLNNFPIHLLKNTVSLRSMCFGWMDINTRLPEWDSPRQPKLKFLDLSFEPHTGQGTTLIDTLTQHAPAIDISELEHIIINGERVLNIQQLLSHCKNDLRILELRSNEYPTPTPPTHIDLRPLHSLHSLSLLVPVIDWDEISANPFPWLDYLLSNLCRPPAVIASDKKALQTHPSTTHPSLHTLYITFDIDRVNLFEKIDALGWVTLNDHFTRLIKTCSSTNKRNMEINIYIYTDFDSCETYPAPQLAPPNNFSSTPRSGNTTGNGDNSRRKTILGHESTQMGQYLARFLPVLKAKEGLEAIRVFRTAYIPRF